MVFARPAEREAMAAAARAAGVGFYGLFLAADLSTRLARVSARGRDASDADRKVAEAQEGYHLGGSTGRRSTGTIAQTAARARGTGLTRRARADIKRPALYD
jgi:uncharacterized protein